LRLPRRRSVGTPLYGGLQILLGLSNFVQFRSVLPFGFWSRAFFPLLFIDVSPVYLKEPRIPFEPPLWYDRFFWQNPVRVTRPVPPGRCPFSSTLSTFRRVGLPVDSLSVRFRSFDLLLPFPVFRLSSSVSGLATLSVFPAIPTLRLVGFCLTGDQSYY